MSRMQTSFCVSKKMFFVFFLLLLAIAAIIGVSLVEDYFVTPFYIAPAAQEIVKDANSDYTKAYLLFDWVRGHIGPPDDNLVAFLRLAGIQNAWFFFVGQGRCGEVSNVYAIMARTVGLEVKKIRNDGETHQWNEVLINGEWIHVDASVHKFNDPQYYERELHKQYSFIYWYDEQISTKQSVTSGYTDTASLLVSVKDHNLPVVRAHIIVQSNFYPEGYYAVDGFTNESGEYQITLGDNNYTILAIEDFGFYPWARKVEMPIELKPHDVNYLDVDLSEVQPAPNDNLVTYAIVAIVIIFIWLFCGKKEEPRKRAPGWQ